MWCRGSRMRIFIFFHEIYLEDKLLQKFWKSGILGSARSIASMLKTWSPNQFCIDFPIVNLLWFHENNSFWSLFSNSEAIDLVDAKIPDFRKFCNNLSSAYILWKNTKFCIPGHLNHLFSRSKHFSSDFQHGVYPLRSAGVRWKMLSADSLWDFCAH